MTSAFLDLDNAKSIENEASIACFVPQSYNANGADTSSSPLTVDDDDADGRSISPKVPAFDDEQSIENGSFSNMNNVTCTSCSPGIENAAGRNLFEDEELIENRASTVQFANVSNSSSTENDGVSKFSYDISALEFENVVNIEDENGTSIAIFAAGSSNAIDANTSSIYRTENIAGSNSGFLKMIDESDNNASASTVSRHLSPVHSFGRDPFIFFPPNNMDIFGHGIDYPIYSRSASEDYGELFIEEHSDKRAAAGDKQMMTGNHHVLPSSSVARRRWRMAINVVAFGDMQARKKMRLK